MRQNYKLQRFNRVVIALAILVLLVGGFFASVKFLTPASEQPVEAATVFYSGPQFSVSYDWGMSGMHYIYAQTFIYTDNAGINSVSLNIPYTWADYGTSTSKMIHFPYDLSISLRGYEWNTSSTSFRAYVNYYISELNMNDARSNALEKINGGSYEETINYTRSGNSFDSGSDDHFYPGSILITSNKYVAVVIRLEKDSSDVIANSYTLYFSYDGGTGSTTSKSVRYDSIIGSLPNTTRENYIFQGWYIGNIPITTSSTWTWASDQTAVAQWTFDGYTLSYNVNNDVGGSIVGASTEYLKNTSVVVTASPDNNYVFSHWVLNGETLTINPLTFTITQNSTLTAYFTKLPEVTSSTGGAEFATFNTETLDLSYRYNITFTTDNYLYSATVNTGAEQRIASMNGMLTVPDNSCTAIIYYTNETGSRLFLEIIGVTGDVTINLTFSNVSQSFSPTSGGGASGIVVSATAGGVASVVGDDFENLADDDEILYIAKLAQNGYQFSHWEDAEGNFLGTTDNLLLTKAEAYNTKVIAVFIPTNQENTNSTTDTQPTDTPEII